LTAKAGQFVRQQAARAMFGPVFHLVQHRFPENAARGSLTVTPLVALQALS